MDLVFMQFFEAADYFCQFISHSSLIAMVVKIHTEIRKKIVKIICSMY